MIHGYDISNVNGPNLDVADLDEPKEFIVAKASQDVSFVDREFQRHRARARQLGLAFGGYHYGDNYAQPDGGRSADFFIETIGEDEEGEFAALDAEHDDDDGYGGLHGNCLSWVMAWGNRFTQRKKYKSKLYTNVAGLDEFNLRHPEVADAFDLWLAAWGVLTPPVSPSPFRTYGLWQYNADVVDKDWWFGTVDELKATGKPKAPSTDSYESKYWTPIQKLLDDMIANSSSLTHADQAFHAAVSNNITLHKVARGFEPG